MTPQAWKSALPLENEDVKLVPFDIERHGPSLQAIANSSEIWAHLSNGPFASLSGLCEYFHADSHSTLVLVIIYKSSTIKQEEPHDGQDGGPVAGLISVTTPDARKPRASIENLILLPDFRSQGLAFMASRLLVDAGLRYASEGGVGLVEISWECSTKNEAARRVAIRVGLREGRPKEYYDLLENGVERGKIGNGKEVLKGTAEGDVWQDVVVYVMTAQEWERITELGEEEEAEESDDDDDEEEDEDFVMDEDDDSAEDDEFEGSDSLQAVHHGVSHLELE